MMQWSALFKKEMLENWRNKKWLWFPLVMILIAIMDPISNYYLPQIIKSVGGLPEGAVLELPEFTPVEAIMMSLGQLSSLGVLIIVLISMGSIASEKKSGVIELILVKPVSYANYITAKWASLFVLIWTALFLSLVCSWYYINILFGSFSLLQLIQVTFFYGIWLTLVITISIFYNSLFHTPGLVAFLSAGTVIAMSVLTKVFHHILTWSPNKISEYIHTMLLTGEIPSELIATSSITAGCIGLLLFFSIIIIQKKELGSR
ncbi:ABC transporter permease [Virgibacillus sp. SK37]|nr:ABC transporter permease [Virgibacillus sp. SK37]